VLDMMAATTIANAAGNKIALVLAAFKDSVTLRPTLLQPLCSEDEFPCHQISICKCKPLLHTM
jgi:hypothetical protein